MKGRILLTLLLVISMLILPEYGYSLSSRHEYGEEHGSQSLFTPGYANASKQRTDSIVAQWYKNNKNIVNQANQSKGFWSNVLDYLKGKLYNKVKEASVEKPLPELKKKTSRSGDDSTKKLTSSLADSDYTKRVIPIGSGTNQVTDSNGRIVSEVINGTKYIYANSDASSTKICVQTISAAMNSASSGDVIIAMAGDYYESFGIKNGVSVLGGYNYNGTRTADSRSTLYLPERNADGSHGIGIDASYITQKTEISGFAIDKSNVYAGIIANYSNENLLIKYNTFTNINGLGIWANGSSAIIENNIFKDFVKFNNWDVLNGAVGIFSIGSDLTIRNNTFSDMINNRSIGPESNVFANFMMTGEVYGGIVTYGSKDSITQNYFDGCGSGIINVRSNTLVSQNRFYNNSNGTIYGTMSNIKATSNLIYNDTGSDIVLADWRTIITLENNIIAGSTIGMSTSVIGNFFSAYISAILFGITPDFDVSTGVISSNNNLIYASESLGAGYYDVSNVFNAESPLQFIDNKLTLKDAYASYGSLYDIADAGIARELNQNYENLANPNAMALSPELKTTAEDLNASFLNSNPNSIYSADSEGVINSILFAMSANMGSINPESSFNEYEMMIMAAMALSRNMEGSEESIKRLNEILKNPTETTKMVMKSLSAIIESMKVLDESQVDPALKEARKGMMDVISAMLLAQAIPDLLTETDVANIKSILNDLENNRSNIMRTYDKATKPYYDEMKKMLIESMYLLKSNDILSTTINEEELAKLSRSELDKILEKIRRSKNQELDKISQKEAEYRKQYIEPNNKLLGEEMKTMLKNFTKSMSSILESKNIK